MRRYLCEPIVMYTQLVYEAEGDHSTEAIYNCHECFNHDCGYWSDYNHYEEDEEERTLDPDWAEFFNATCERYRKND